MPKTFSRLSLFCLSICIGAMVLLNACAADRSVGIHVERSPDFSPELVKAGGNVNVTFSSHGWRADQAASRWRLAKFEEASASRTGLPLMIILSDSLSENYTLINDVGCFQEVLKESRFRVLESSNSPYRLEYEIFNGVIGEGSAIKDWQPAMRVDFYKVSPQSHQKTLLWRSELCFSRESSYMSRKKAHPGRNGQVPLSESQIFF